MPALRRFSPVALGGSFIAFITLLIYARCLGNAFVGWDDGLLILENPTVQGLTMENIRRAFTTYDPELYIPLTFLSYQINFAIGGLNPLGYHLINLLLHIINALLVMMIARRITGLPWAGFACALLFALHPINTEAVAWISARKDVLSAVFGLGSLLLWLRWREDGRRWMYVASIALFALGLLSKVSTLVLPAVMMLIDLLDRRITIKDKLPYLGLTTAFAVIALGGKTAASVGLTAKFLIGMKATVILLGKMFLPLGLSVVYPYVKPITLANADLLMAASIVTVVSVLCAVFWKKSRIPLLAWLAFLGLLAPSFWNIAKGHNASLDIYVTSDRYAYLASIIPFLLVGVMIDRFGERRPLAALGVFVLLTGSLGFLAFRQSMVWRSTETLFVNAARWYPQSYIAHGNLGTLYVQQGRLEEGLREYAKALEIRPDGITWYNVGVILRDQGKTDQAVKALQKSVEISPNDAVSWQTLGELFAEQGKAVESQRALEEAKKVQEIRTQRLNRNVL